MYIKELIVSDEYGPLQFFIGRWESKGYTGENKAPDPERQEENTKFRQEIIFTPAGVVENHEQALYALNYSTQAWEEGEDEEPFHQERGYFLWDPANGDVMKSFIVPRGITVNAGGNIEEDATSFTVSAKVGDDVYGICSNPFLDKEFKSISYDVTFSIIDKNTFSYDENTQIKIKGREKLFQHTEKNIMVRCS